MSLRPTLGVDPDYDFHLDFHLEQTLADYLLHI